MPDDQPNLKRHPSGYSICLLITEQASTGPTGLDYSARRQLWRCTHGLDLPGWKRPPPIGRIGIVTRGPANRLATAQRCGQDAAS